MARIDDANRRILTKKFELGLFERPLTDRSFTPTVGNAAHRSLARQAVRESQVLLKNAGNVLPLAKANSKIFVAGKNADNIGNQSGGWTISWQGGSGTTTPGTSILQGIRNTRRTVHHGHLQRDRRGHRQHLPGRHRGRGRDAVRGGSRRPDRFDEPGHRPTSTPSTRCAAPGVPVVVVLVSGRPLDIAAQLPNWNALVAAWLPGTEGQGVADVLFGEATARPASCR